MLEGMASRLAFALVPLVAACGAKLGAPPLDQHVADAAIDSPVVVDAPIDARPCIGGDATAMAGASCLVLVKTPAHHEDAVASCTAMNAHLVKIDDAATNTIVAALAKGADTFIGATDLVTEGTFVWDDGTPVVYNNFRTGEPSNGGGQYQEDCLVIEGSKTPDDTWDDRPCDPVAGVGGGNYAFICQY